MLDSAAAAAAAASSSSSTELVRYRTHLLAVTSQSTVQHVIPQQIGTGIFAVERVESEDSFHIVTSAEWWQRI